MADADYADSAVALRAIADGKLRFKAFPGFQGVRALGSVPAPSRRKAFNDSDPLNAVAAESACARQRASGICVCRWSYPDARPLFRDDCDSSPPPLRGSARNDSRQTFD